MKVIIDRFEGNFAIAELPDKTMVSLDRQFIPTAAEGDVISIEIDSATTEKRKKNIDKIGKNLWRS